MEYRHTPVLLKEAADALNIRPDGIYADGTLGGGGHAYEICSRLGARGRFVGIDKDRAAIAAAGARLSVFGEKVAIIHGDYRDMKTHLRNLGIGGADGIILDLGVSSNQLDDPKRGFSYRADAPLDMRMDTDGAVTARDIVNGYGEAELYRVIRDYGEDRFAKNIARHIVREREKAPIDTTGRLAGIVRGAVPAKYGKGGGHPAKRTFQAIRIELNGELTALEESLESMIDLLNPGGRICVITFHSLEDRIVKDAFRKGENPCTCPKEFPVCVCGKVSKGKVITKKPVLPSAGEIERNSRAQSAKMRIFEKRR